MGLYEKFLEVLQQDGHMTAEALSTFKLDLTMRSAAPRVEAHYQYYKTAVEPYFATGQKACLDWIMFGGGQYCAPSMSEVNLKISGHT